MNRPGKPDFNRAPFIVIWETTRSCDLVCEHCRAEAQTTAHPDEITDDHVYALLRHVREEFGPILFVLTGGDPLKRANLLDFIRYGSELGLRMAITPSATPLLTTQAVRDLHEAGIQRMAVSLDGKDAATHDSFRGVSGTFERTLAALKVAQEIGLQTQINTSVGSVNWNQLDAISEIAAFYEIALWSVFIIVPTGRAESEMLMTAAEHEKVYRALAERAIDPDTTFDIKTTAGQPYYRVRAQFMKKAGLNPMATVTTGKDGKGGMRAPGGVNDGNGFVFIDHRGNIQPSGFLPITCGNVRTDSLAEVYRTDETFVRLRTPDSFEGKCGVCEWNKICGGSRSRTYGLTGDAFASDPTCVYVPPKARTS